MGEVAGRCAQNDPIGAVVDFTDLGCAAAFNGGSALGY
jgi:hypothetical protein